MPQIDVTSSGVRVLRRDAYRTYLYIENSDDDIEVRLDRCQQTAINYAAAPIRLRPGDSMILVGANESVQDEWSATTNAGTATLFIDDGHGEFVGASKSAGLRVSYARLVANSAGSWVNLIADPNGLLKVRTDDRNYTSWTVFDEIPIGALETVLSAEVEVGACGQLTAFISTNRNVTVRVQFSTDAVNWYEPKTAADADLSWNCTNEKICFAVPVVATYVRLVVANADASGGTVTAELGGLI